MSLGNDVAEVATSPLKSIKLAVIGGLVAVFLVVCGLGYYFYKQHMNDQKTIGQVTEQKEEVKQNLAVAEVHIDANASAQQKASSEKTKLDNGFVESKQKQKQREEVVNTTISDPVQQEQAKAESRMEEIWDNYCLVEPQNAACQKQAEPPKGQAGQTQAEGNQS